MSYSQPDPAEETTQAAEPQELDDDSTDNEEGTNATTTALTDAPVSEDDPA